MTDLLRSILLPFALLFLALALVALWFARDLGSEARLLDREGLRTLAEITWRQEHIPSGTDRDGQDRSGLPTYTLHYRFTHPESGVVQDARTTVSRGTWLSVAEGDRREVLVARSRPEVSTLFGTEGMARGARQLGTLAVWLGLISLVLLSLHARMRRQGRQRPR